MNHLSLVAVLFTCGLSTAVHSQDRIDYTDLPMQQGNHLSISASKRTPHKANVSAFCIGYNQSVMDNTVPDSRSHIEANLERNFFFEVLQDLGVDDGSPGVPGVHTKELNYWFDLGYKEHRKLRVHDSPKECFDLYSE